MQKFYDDPVDTLDGNWENESQLLDETNYTIRDAIDSPIKRILWDGLFASESLSSLRKEWFTGNKFTTGTLVSDIKDNHLGLKYQNSFY